MFDGCVLFISILFHKATYMFFFSFWREALWFDSFLLILKHEHPVLMLIFFTWNQAALCSGYERWFRSSNRFGKNHVDRYSTISLLWITIRSYLNTPDFQFQKIEMRYKRKNIIRRLNVNQVENPIFSFDLSCGF